MDRKSRSLDRFTGNSPYSRKVISGTPPQPTRPIRAGQQTPVRAPPSAQRFRSIRCARPTRRHPVRIRRKWRPEAPRLEGQRRGRWILRLPRKTPLLALSLLTSVATAYAECAWVFWLEVSGPPTHESSSRPLSGWGTREACEQALTQRLAADSEKDTSMDVTVEPQAGRPRLWVRRKGHPELLAVYTYVCLPDTVDPRGGKGK